jgi:hypothetical protein
VSPVEPTLAEVRARRPDSDPSPASHPAGEAALLATCLRGDPFAVPADTDWDGLQKLARMHGVLALVQKFMREAGVKTPSSFSHAAQSAREAAAALAAELTVLLRVFAERGIEVLPLKGPPLAQSLYGDVNLRPSSDLDLLLRRNDLSRAGTLMQDLGFAARPQSDYDRRFVRGRLAVELHFELASPQYCRFDTAGLWKRSRSGEFQGQPVRILADDDLVLYLCSHGLKHGYSRLIWILDVARALHGRELCACDELMSHARKLGLLPWLLIGCEVVRAVFPRQLPSAMDAVAATWPKAAERARRAARRLFSEDLSVSLKDHREFYLQAEPDLLRRWRYRLGYLAPTGSDLLWAERHGIEPRLMPLLRPFRLLRRYGLSQARRILFPAGLSNHS